MVMFASSKASRVITAIGVPWGRASEVILWTQHVFALRESFVAAPGRFFSQKEKRDKGNHRRHIPDRDRDYLSVLLTGGSAAGWL